VRLYQQTIPTLCSLQTLDVYNNTLKLCCY